MDNDLERMQILQMIEDGRISAEEGLLLLKSLNEDGADPEFEDLDQAAIEPAARPDLYPRDEPQVVVEPAYTQSMPDGLPAAAARWRRWWTIPLWIGAGVAVIGSLFMYAALQSAGGIGFWFLCATVPFVVGVLAIAFAWISRVSLWLHLRVQQAPGEWPQQIAFSFPLPLRLAAWFLRIFGRYIPNLQDQRLDEIILAVGRSASPDNPIYIQVDEGESGEKVEIFIG